MLEYRSKTWGQCWVTWPSISTWSGNHNHETQLLGCRGGLVECKHKCDLPSAATEKLLVLILYHLNKYRGRSQYITVGTSGMKSADLKWYPEIDEAALCEGWREEISWMLSFKCLIWIHTHWRQLHKHVTFIIFVALPVQKRKKSICKKKHQMSPEVMASAADGCNLFTQAGLSV